MNTVIAIVGPTGVGKTKLSVELAKYFKSEIINGDSVQIYKDLNIGSAKVKEEEKEGIIHHLLDIKNIEEDYTIYDYQQDLRNKINDLNSRKLTPIIVGGSGLYLKSALYDYSFNKEDDDSFNEYTELSNEEAFSLLEKLDPNEASKLHPNNRVRVIRALNIIENSKMSKTELLSKQEHKMLYDAKFIGLTSSREIVYQRINDRVEVMIENGLLNETKSIFDKYGMHNYSSLKAIGYKEIFEYYRGNMSLNDSIELIKKRSRNYAKRQYTWFNNQFDVKWFNTNFEDFSVTVNEVINHLKENGYE